MLVKFSRIFLDDLEQIGDRKLKARIIKTIVKIDEASSLDDIPNLKKLHGTNDHYRLRLGDYRFGLIVRDDTVIFVRFLHRKEIYRYFRAK